MQDAAVMPLTPWADFYMIVASGAAVLIGLMFVVTTLVASQDMKRSFESIGAFGTPTVVHFSLALLVSTALSAPWFLLWAAGLAPGITGIGGVIYELIVFRRTRRQTDYQPDWEDWSWHIIIPLCCYVVFIVASIFLPIVPEPALFAIAAGLVLLLLLGIHNAWDTITYITFREILAEDEEE